MEKVLEFILNPYCYIFIAALVIMGLTQLIKLIPCFKDNNWNISFPVVFGYMAAFGWAILTQYEIQPNIEILLAFGTGIGALSSTLYGIIKKLCDKDYKMEKEIENSDIYKFLNNLFSADVKDFANKPIIEKLTYIKKIVEEIKNIIDNSKVETKEELKSQINVFLGKFLSTNTFTESLDIFMNIIEKNYKLPVKKPVEAENNAEGENK